MPRTPLFKPDSPRRIDRIFVLQSIFFLVGLIFIARLFYLQVIKQEHYKSSARAEQYKQLEIEPERGSISVLDSTNDPILLAINESRFLIFADPVYVKDPSGTAEKLAPVIGVDKSEIEEKLKKELRYVILAKKVTKDVRAKVEGLGLKGVAWKEERIRAYPQGSLAAHVLGFVNDEGDGQYGIEGYLNDDLRGEPGQVRAVTDIEGTPLALNKDNVIDQPDDGNDIILTIDQTIQRVSEEELKAGVERSGAKSGSIVVVETDTGRVKAMANYPTYDVSNYTKVENAAVYQNRVVSEPLEPGSVLKTLTVGAAIDSGAVGKNHTYFDPGFVQVDDSNIRNVTDLGSGTRSVFDILHYSLNTGAVHLLKQMGGGDITEEGRIKWHSYLTERYRFDKTTGVEQEEEAVGIIPSPSEGDGLRVQYANTAFGQGLSVTIMQLGGALSAAINGGTYYKPTLVYSTGEGTDQTIREPTIVDTGVLSASSSADLVSLMKDYVDVMAPDARRDGFVVGGKTGTAQLAAPGGGYRADVYNATFAGFVGKSKPKYTVIVRLDEGSSARNFGGFQDARPVFTGVVNGIMDNIPITD